MARLQDTLAALGLYLACGVILVGAIYLVGRNDDGVFDPIGEFANRYRPNPKVVSVTSRYIRGVFDDDVEILCTVENSGAAGTVNLFAVLASNSERWQKKETIRMAHEGVADVRFLFSEFQRGHATFGVTTNDHFVHDPRILKPVEE